MNVATMEKREQMNGRITVTRDEVRDHRVEQLLAKRNVRWTFVPQVQIAEIKMAAENKRNSGREVPIIPWLVDRYAAAMLDGDVFPAIVLLADLTLAGGYHRIAAAMAVGNTVYDGAYILDDLNPTERDILVRELNQVEGLSLTREEAMRQGKWLVTHHGVSIEESASRFGLNKATLGAALQADETKARLQTQGVVPDLPPSTLQSLSRIPSDPVLKEAALLVKRARLNVNEAADLARAVVATRSDGDGIAAVQAYGERPDVAERARERAVLGASGGARREHTTRRLNMALGSTLKLLQDGERAEVPIINAEGLRLWEMIVPVMARLRLRGLVGPK